MSSKVKKILWIMGIIIVVLVVLFGVAYLTLAPKPLKPPQAVSNLAELEAYLDDLTGHNADSPPGLSLVVVKDGAIVYQSGFGLADGPRGIPATADSVYNQWSMVKPITAKTTSATRTSTRVNPRWLGNAIMSLGSRWPEPPGRAPGHRR